MGGIYTYTVEMGSGAMICIPCFIKTGSAIQKFMGGKINRHTDSMEMA
jgi:coenzyme F420-reducing hydrogenase beta subunit